MEIWVVEDDEDIREIVLYALRNSNFEATGFETGEDLFAALGKSTPNLIILDIMLPGDDGLAILKRLRQSPHHQALPVIMLTAKSGEYDKVKGLDLGADDYLSKPFGVLELLSRVKALLRRTGIAPGEEYQNIKINHAQRIVTVDGEAVTLTFKEYELLHYLLINAGIVMSRDRILEKIWGYDYEGESRTLDMHIKQLRQKLGAAGTHIKTIRSVGYKLG